MIYSIYKVTNLINGKCYIGFDSRWPHRKAHHLWKVKSKKENAYLHRAIRKHGIDSFKWEVIYQSKDKNHTLHKMENYFISQYNSFRPNGYNCSLGGEGSMGVVKSKQTRTKQSLSMKALYNSGWKSAKSQKWLVTTPTGDNIEILSLRKFACENNLINSSLLAVAGGKRNHHRGYKVQRIG